MTTATTTPEETISVSRSKLVEIFAALDAAASLAAVEDDKLYPEYRAGAIAVVAYRLQEELLGSVDEDEARVEQDALSSEFEAEMIDLVMTYRVSGEEVRQTLMARNGRSAQLRLHARRTRENGSVDGVVFPSSKEAFEDWLSREADDAS